MKEEKMLKVVPELFFFYGFYGDKEEKFFIQIADRCNNIIASWEKAVTDKSPEALLLSLPISVPDEVRGTYSRPKGGLYRWNGQRLLESGKENILDCEVVESPLIERSIFAYACSIFKDG